MTVSTTSYLIQYSGDGSTVAFATGFEFIADADLVVQETVVATGVTTTKVLTTDYTVAGAGSDAGGTVTFVTAPASGVRVTIYRSTALTQATDYTEGDPFPAETHEQALDKLTLIEQESRGKFDRALQFRETEDRSGGTKNSYVPTPSQGKVLAWDSDGNLENVSFGAITYDLSISGGDAGKVVVVNSTEDGIEVGDLPVSSAATASTIAKRDANGRIKVADPSAAQDAASKNYVDSYVNTDAAPSGYVRYSQKFMASTNLSQFDFDTNFTGPAFETIGPTGSGADHIWTALDDLPTGCKTVTLNIRITAYDTGGAGFIDLQLGLGKSNLVGDYTDFYWLGYQGGTLATQVGWTQQVEVLLASGNIIHMQWQTNADTNIGLMYLHGFGK